MGAGGTLDASILAASRKAKSALFGEQVFAIVPLYVTSFCIERCLYCNYRVENRAVELERVRLSDGELLQEAEYLIEEKGLRALELVYATDPRLRVDSMCKHVRALKGLLDEKGGGIVGINAEPLETDDYSRLADSGLDFVVLWQETYDAERYRVLHPGNTKKADMDYRLNAYERMILGGVRHFGMGVLSGLSDWREDWSTLISHESYLYSEYGMVPAILGVPRLKPAAGSVLQNTGFVPSREQFLVAVALHNIFSPTTLPFVSTREDWQLCVDLCQGGGSLFTFNCSTIPGGYSLGHNGYQFPTHSYDAQVFGSRLADTGLRPVFDWSFESVPGVGPEWTPEECTARL